MPLFNITRDSKYSDDHVNYPANKRCSSFDPFIRLDWVQSFKVVDENEDCDVRHLEIVCTFGSAPRNAEIIKFFGEDILPFITYKESKFPFLSVTANSS